MNHDGVVNDIQAMLEGAEPAVTGECCIYRVPFEIRRLNEDAYTPKVVSIGPFHHRRHPRLQNMERHKLLYCKAFLQRPIEVSLDTLIQYIEEVEPKFRRCYSDTIELSKEELVKLILVDSCFVLELFYRSYYEEWSGDDMFLLKPWLESDIRLDLLLLENQLPFFVLDRLFYLSFTSKCDSGRIPSFLVFAFKYFDYFNRSNKKKNNNNNNSSSISTSISIRHFTDLIRTFHLQHPLERRSRRTDKPLKQFPSATELKEAGVRFKVITESECLLDLKFSGGVLEIPELKVEDRTELLFRNMVALEQCHYPRESYITDYVAVLDFLINTGRDVDVLVQKKILVNWLGDTDSVANLFNSLWKNITHSNFSSHYLHICANLNDFCQNPCHKLKATLRRDYCSTPWQIVASIAGILLLVLSLIQSVCSLLQVVQQYNDPSKTL